MPAHMRLHGPFSIRGTDEADCTPRSRKAVAVLAMLALSPGMRRPRSWIADKLWSDRGEAQASGSLRQTLSELRQALGSDRAVLGADNYDVWLDPSQVTFDIDVERCAPLAGYTYHRSSELLEGLSIRDREFENWIRDIRSVWNDRVDAPANHVRTAVDRSKVPDSGRYPGPILIAVTAFTRRERQVVAHLQSIAVQALTELGFSVVTAPRGDTRFAIALSLSGDGGSDCAFHVTVRADQSVALWTGNSILKDRAPASDIMRSRAAAIRLVNDAVDCLVGAIGNGVPPDEPLDSSVLVSLGARRIFSLGNASFDEAARLFAAAGQTGATPVLSAWLAFLNTMMLGESLVQNREALVDEARAHVATALESAPHNATVLALCAHYHNFVSRDFFTGFELSRRSIERNPYNALALTVHAQSNLYLGQTAEASELSHRSSLVASNGMTRFFCDSAQYMAAALAREHERALALAQTSQALKPGFLAPIRYQAVLNLHRRDMVAAEQNLADMKALRPDYSLADMRENGSRIPGFAGSDFFNFDLPENS